jgi:hypothetical protein
MSTGKWHAKKTIYNDHGLSGAFPDWSDGEYDGSLRSMNDSERDWEEWPIEGEEAVDHPAHYNQGSLEVIDAIEGLGYAEGFCVGSIIKYVTRYKHKNGVEDLKKAQWYIDYLIKMEEK